jgi:hypothetical protein
MTQAESVVLEHLRYIRDAVDGLRDDMSEMKVRLSNLVCQFANLSNRMAWHKSQT